MAHSQDASSISVVVPVYGCAGCIEQLCDGLKQNLDQLTARWEVILVDDGSPDDAWATIAAIQTRYPKVKGIRLSRNFGQQIAISAGLAAARGDYAVVMDCDLQDPAEEIGALYAKIQEGYDLVLARRCERGQTVFRKLGARIYFKLISRLTGEEIDGSYGSFSMLSRKVIDSFLQFGERERHYLFVLRWLGFRVGIIDYIQQRRTIGRSSYSLKRLLQHAVSGVFFQATVLLRWIIGLGLLFAVFGVILALFFVYGYFSRGAVPGWTSVVVLLLICTGVVLSSLGVVGLYIGKIFDQVKERPLYIIDAVSERRIPW